MEGLANTLKETKAGNKRLQVEVEKGSEAKAEIKRLKAELKKEKEHSAALTDYYNLTEPKIEALREEVRGVPSEDASAFDFSEWTQQAGLAVSDCVTAYGDCCARVSAAFTMGLLQQFGSEHIAEFPNFAKGDWEFWQKDGRSTAKARLLEHLAKAEAADQAEEPAAKECGGDAGARVDIGQDHPEVVFAENCVRPSFGNWRSKNEKFVAVKGLPKVRCPFRPVYREMVINGNSYKVLKVAGWMRTHPGWTLDDYDCVHVERREDMIRFWRNH
uniref:Uncharacterized protein n=1 Tax=Oryza sativa subsp. japonica TaxID=39947 RepID=Q2QWC6_ORYSJ|nr:hypothetical protein LOC_Os12g09810 [Oryza sativa Japonica Group]